MDRGGIEVEGVVVLGMVGVGEGQGRLERCWRRRVAM